MIWISFNNSYFRGFVGVLVLGFDIPKCLNRKLLKTVLKGQQIPGKGDAIEPYGLDRKKLLEELSGDNDRVSSVSVTHFYALLLKILVLSCIQPCCLCRFRR